MQKSTFQPNKLWQLVKRANPPKGLIVLAIILGIIETGVGLAVPLLTMNMINRFAEGDISFLALLFVAGVLIVQAAISGIAFYMMMTIGEKIVAAIRERVWGHVLQLRITYFDAHESGETMSRITQDTNVVKELITQHIITFFTGILTIIGSVGILLWIDWKMTLLMLIAVPLSIGVMLPLGQKMNQIAKANQDELASFSGNLGRVLTNIRLVKAYQAEPLEKEKGKAQIVNLYRFGLKEAKVLAILSPIMTLVMMLVLILLFGYGGAQVATGAISAGALVAIMFYLVQIIVPFTQMATFFTSLQKALGATERLHELLAYPVEQGGVAQPDTKQANIIFDAVAFQYGDKPIFNQLSLTIPAGKTTALVGASGGGKTTLFSLMERFYELTGGAIYYGTQSIEQLCLDRWRGLFGYVSQESPLMNGTVRENVQYGTPNATEQEIIDALQKAHAWDFVQMLEGGLDAQVGEGGIKLSGGQRQRIAIARAILRNPPILLLDEATSNLDNESEKYVQAALQQAMQGRTTIIIAHRLSTITHADQIIVLENGHISGTGTHQELLQEHAYYKKLVRQSAEVI
ncbi:ABC transporter ATP-binding protein [Lysinibacillus sp. KU-BSD001]|uniref:ABC transporter ATP-binding protein n=1 Tax=Lysinibacillus sp. KU-BSD001 TaxID=3141328 RepID=UPI0036E652BE